MKNPVGSIALILLSLLVAVTGGTAAAANYQWDASSGLFPDQVVPAMTLFDGSNPEDPQLSGGVLTISNDVHSEYIYYQIAGAQFGLPASASLSITAEVRFVSGTTSSAGRSAAAIGFSTAPGVGGGLWLEADAIFLQGPGVTRGPAASVDTDDGFHIYRIETAGTAAGSTVHVFQDNVLRLTGTLYADATDFGATEFVFWGEGTTVAAGTAEWKSFSYNAVVIPKGALQVTITPPEAVTAGAQWQLDGGAFQNSGTVVTNLTAGEHAIAFKPVLGWFTPSNQIVTVSAYVTNTATAVYTARSVAPARGPGRLFGFAGGAYGGIIAFNPGTNSAFFLTPATFVGDTTYPVEQRSWTSHASVNDDGRIMAVTSTRNAVIQPGNHISVLNGDGTGMRQITFPYYGGYGDDNPVISPDGSRVAFISRRATNTLYQGEVVRSPQLFIVSVTGSNLTQITSGTDRINPGDFPGVQTWSADWSPDGQKLAYRGIRIVRPVGGDPYYSSVVGVIDLQAQTDTILFGTYSTGGSLGIDWSPSGKYIVAGHGGEAQGAPQPRIYIYNTQTGLLLEDFRVGNPAQGYGQIRVAPDDSFYIVTRADMAFTHGYRLVSLEAADEVRSYPAGIVDPFYWQPGPNWPRPVKLVTQPAYLEIPRGFDGTGVVNAVLYGADGHVMSRMASWWDDVGTIYSTRFSQWGDVQDRPGPGGFSRFRAYNGGFTNDLVIQNGKAKIIFDSFRIWDNGSPTDWFMDVLSRNVGDAQVGSGGGSYPVLTLSHVPINNPGYSVAIHPNTSARIQGLTIPKNQTSSGPKVLRLRGTYPGGSYSASLRVIIP